MTSQVDLGITTPVLGLTQYFLGFVVLTCKTMNCTPKQNYNSPQHTKIEEGGGGGGWRLYPKKRYKNEF